MNTGMTGRALSGRSVLVVEDDFFLAHDLAAILEAEGAEVLGPAGTLTERWISPAAAPAMQPFWT